MMMYTRLGPLFLALTGGLRVAPVLGSAWWSFIFFVQTIGVAIGLFVDQVRR